MRLLPATAVVIGLMLSACGVTDPVPDGSERVSDAWQHNQPVPLLSRHFGDELTTAAAYRIQYTALHRLPRAPAPAGFKACLTSAASQQRFGAHGPIAAVLPGGGRIGQREDGYHVALREYRRPLVEVEIGYRVAEPIRNPLPDVAALQAAIGEVLPVIELPDMSHADGEHSFTAIDLIASNAGARHFIAGPARAPRVLDPDSVSVVLYHDGNVETQGRGRDALGDQWQALLFLVNRTLASGWTIERGQVLITGALGRAVPLQKGIYVADYGSLGRIEWVSE